MNKTHCTCNATLYSYYSIIHKIWNMEYRKKQVELTKLNKVAFTNYYFNTKKDIKQDDAHQHTDLDTDQQTFRGKLTERIFSRYIKQFLFYFLYSLFKKRRIPSSNLCCAMGFPDLNSYPIASAKETSA